MYLISFVHLTRASDRFRWVECQLAYLAKCFPRDIQVILNRLPATLDETYERTLREIDETKWESARQLLICVAVASRPLRVEELAEILAFDFKSGGIPKFHEDWRLKNPVDAVISACSTLLSVVNVETHSRTFRVVKFSHFTVKEFLMSSRFAERHDNISRHYHITMPPAHTFVAKACLGVLLHLDKAITRQSLMEFPLAEYAAESWFVHARFEGVSEDIVEWTKQLFDWTKPHLSIWLWIHDPTEDSWYRQRSERPSLPFGTPLHYAAFCGLHDIAEILAIEHPEDVNSQSFKNASSPLHVASREGHMKLAGMLIKRGANVSAQTKNGWTALHLALEKGHVNLAQMLVERGADVSAQNEVGSTALHLASIYDHIDLARMLVKRGADVSAPTKDGWTALHWALQNGHVNLAQMLVERGADVSAQTKDGWIALHLASRYGHADLARVLVERGADVLAQINDGSTALHLASRYGHANLARMLVHRGADVLARTKDGSTALHLASRYGHAGLAWMLVERGADVSAQNKYGWTALHLASIYDHADLARMLVERGANMSSRTRDGRTALHWALENGHVRISQMLVEHGADVSARNKCGLAALHLASIYGHADLARMLVKRGADVSAQNE